MTDDLNYIDLMFPDLLPEDPMINNLISMETPQLLPSSHDIKTISDRLENLEIVTNTHSLRIEVERVKRQKLRSSLKQFKHDAFTPSADMASLRQTVTFNYDQQTTTNYQLGGKLDKLSTLTFRCLSRMQQLLTTVIPRIASSPDDYNSIMQQLDEIGRTIQQFRVYHQVSYVWGVVIFCTVFE